MTTTTLPAASPPPVLDLDTRLALLNIEMDGRLAEAAVTFEVNTVHIAGAEPVPHIADTVPTIPLTPILAPAADPYDTPIASLLHRARAYIETRGLLQGALRDDNDVEGARCPIGAIRYEAATSWQADDACALLLEAIRRDFPDASVASYVDAQTDAAPVLLHMDGAAQLAHARGI